MHWNSIDLIRSIIKSQAKMTKTFTLHVIRAIGSIAKFQWIKTAISPSARAFNVGNFILDVWRYTILSG